LDTHIVGVELFNSTKETFMQREDVFHLGWRANPVLSREPEDREKTNIAVGANANNFGQILFAGCMALSAG
jgi:hypothetical protein